MVMPKKHRNLLRILYFLATICVLSSIQLPILSQTNETNKVEILKQSIDPSLGIEASSVSRAKLYVPKKVLRIDEQFTIDVGIFAPSDKFYYFPRYIGKHIDVKFSDENEQKVKILPVYSFDSFAKFKLYRGEIIIDSMRIVVGCDATTMKTFESDFESLEDEDDLEEIFKKELFRSIPEYCLDINKSGKVTVTAKYSNQLVVSDPQNPDIKTVVGELVSNTRELEFLIEN